MLIEWSFDTLLSKMEMEIWGRFKKRWWVASFKVCPFIKSIRRHLRRHTNEQSTAPFLTIVAPFSKFNIRFYQTVQNALVYKILATYCIEIVRRLQIGELEKRSRHFLSMSFVAGFSWIKLDHNSKNKIILSTFTKRLLTEDEVIRDNYFKNTCTTLI